MFPVVDGSKLGGCVSTREIKQVPREEWAKRKVADIATECSEENTIAPDADATDALSTMNKTGNSRLMVVEDGRLLGIVALKDMLKFLAIKLDLEGEESSVIGHVAASRPS
jgi:CBS domain-containing protein